MPQFIAWIKGRQFDGYAWRFKNVLIAVGSDCINRVTVGVKVAIGVFSRQGSLPEHVKGVTIDPVAAAFRTFERFLDTAPHYKLVPHDPHRLLHRRTHDRFTHATHQTNQEGCRILHVAGVRLDDPSGKHEAPCRCVNEQRVTRRQVIFPFTATNLVFDQFVGGDTVRDPK